MVIGILRKPPFNDRTNPPKARPRPMAEFLKPLDRELI